VHGSKDYGFGRPTSADKSHVVCTVPSLPCHEHRRADVPGRSMRPVETWSLSSCRRFASTLVFQPLRSCRTIWTNWARCRLTSPRRYSSALSVVEDALSSSIGALARCGCSVSAGRGQPPCSIFSTCSLAHSLCVSHASCACALMHVCSSFVLFCE
jgi:hypothetical protein